MANPGIGYRKACDILMEMSFHLLQPTVVTTITSLGTGGFGTLPYGQGGYGGGSQWLVYVPTIGAMYPGAQVVVGWNNADAEVATIIGVGTDSAGNPYFTCNLTNTHAAGETILGPTFPTQYDTDPIFTQSEMLQYLARAQNEFLMAVPSYYERFTQNVAIGSIYQSTPATAVQIDRVSASQLDVPITSLVRSGNVVTLTASQNINLAQYSTLSVVNATDSTFNGVFAVASAPAANQVTYPQVAADASTTGGQVQQMIRLYQSTQEEIVMGNRGWQRQQSGPIRNWFEDRAGLYQWGIGGYSGSEFPVELLCAIRDSDTLGLLDGFLVPDVCLHAVKYLALAYAWSKDGVQQNYDMSGFAMKRYAQIVMATQRYIQFMKMGKSA